MVPASVKILHPDMGQHGSAQVRGPMAWPILWPLQGGDPEFRLFEGRRAAICKVSSQGWLLDWPASLLDWLPAVKGGDK